MFNKDIEYLNSLEYFGPKGRKEPEESIIEDDIQEFRLKKWLDQNACFIVEFLERKSGDDKYFVYWLKFYSQLDKDDKFISIELGTFLSKDLNKIPTLERKIFSLYLGF